MVILEPQYFLGSDRHFVLYYIVSCTEYCTCSNKRGKKNKQTVRWQENCLAFEKVLSCYTLNFEYSAKPVELFLILLKVKDMSISPNFFCQPFKEMYKSPFPNNKYSNFLRRKYSLILVFNVE